MKFITAAFALLAIFFATPALAGEAIEQLQLANGCYQYTLCLAEEDDGDCENADGDNYVATFSNGYTNTIFAESSTATDFTCTLRIARDVYSSTVYGVTSPTITVTDAVEILPFDAMVGKSWLNCTITTGTAVTAYVRSCPLAK